MAPSCPLRRLRRAPRWPTGSVITGPMGHRVGCGGGLVHVAGVVVVDGGQDGGERRAGLGRCSSLPVPALRPAPPRRRAAGWPQCGAGPAWPPSPRDRRRAAEPTNRTIRTMSSTGTGIFRLVVSGYSQRLVKPFLTAFSKPTRIRVSRAAGGHCLLRCSLRRRVRRGREGEWGRPVERAGRPDYKPPLGACRPSSQPGRRIAAPAATHRRCSSRSAVTTKRRPGQLAHQGHDRVVARTVRLHHPDRAVVPASPAVVRSGPVVVRSGPVVVRCGSGRRPRGCGPPRPGRLPLAP